jgi:hypothetical protein
MAEQTRMKDTGVKEVQELVATSSWQRQHHMLEENQMAKHCVLLSNA